MTGQLPPAGGTTSSRPPEAPQTAALSLDEAVAAYGVSQSTLRRRLRERAVAGAYKVNGPKGEEWRIPEGALEQLGYSRHTDDVDERRAHFARTGRLPGGPLPFDDEPAPSSPDVERLADVVEQLTSLVEGGQRQLMAAEEDRGAAQRRIEALVGENARLEAELAHARRRRWPFRR